MSGSPTRDEDSTPHSRLDPAGGAAPSALGNTLGKQQHLATDHMEFAPEGMKLEADVAVWNVLK